MGAWRAIEVFAAGVGAGAINSVVGSGTLITFPVLLGLGYAPIIANVSNTIGLAPGNLSGAVGYRRELSGQRARMLRLGGAALLGGGVGAVLLLFLPASVFKDVVPVFIVVALVLVLFQSRISRFYGRRRTGAAHLGRGGPLVWLGIFLCGIYGGYFGAAQGIIALSLLSLSFDDGLQRLNGLKNVLVGATNGIAALVFAVTATQVSWGVAGLIAGGSITGAQFGARWGRRLSPAALRTLIVIVGTAAIVKLVA